MVLTARAGRSHRNTSEVLLHTDDAGDENYLRNRYMPVRSVAELTNPIELRSVINNHSAPSFSGDFTPISSHERLPPWTGVAPHLAPSPVRRHL